ncbi:hypothetical protein TpMuguga_02g02665 [Theileria parva strain Muguga]|uniref:uncharacterized protein n=1 Tax=Theileria parva strain Muguga TaxID=333668 RepID=UPI001C621072|nr:uncharacterized protein TpMuguga_02g02665 [Theileria parva strain Muguga]KAF5153603.1 hypothetical protein TpMuguga_02g02665 [Theileria parva strain Muguga]
MLFFYNFKHNFLFNIFKSRYNKYFSTATLTNELESLVSSCHKLIENPNLLPKHVQKLHNLALQVRSGREFLGISQSDLCVNNQPLLKAERIIYTIYDKINPEFYFVASREPAAIDFYKLYLSTINKSNSKGHRDSLSKWISKYDFDSLGLYILESINTNKISFRNISKARLLFWRSHQFVSFK